MVSVPDELPANDRQDLETLVNMVLPFARSMVAKYGRFYPFGATIRQTGEVAAVTGYDDERGLSPQEALVILQEGLRREIRNGDVKAVAVCSDILVTPTDDSDPVDAIRVHLEHSHGWALLVFLPYEKPENGEVVFGESLLTEQAPEIFRSAHDAAQ
jgi:hypothetical protein